MENQGNFGKNLQEGRPWQKSLRSQFMADFIKKNNYAETGSLQEIFDWNKNNPHVLTKGDLLWLLMYVKQEDISKNIDVLRDNLGHNSIYNTDNGSNYVDIHAELENEDMLLPEGLSLKGSSRKRKDPEK